MTTLQELDNHWLLNSYDKAMTQPDLWGEPIEKKMKNMRDRNVWKVIENPPPDIYTIKTCWTFTNKFDRDGKLTMRKAHLVAKEFIQIPGVDFFESYASVVHYKSLQMNLAIAAANNMKAWQINHVAAYLNSLLQAKVYIKLHDGSVAELLRSLCRIVPIIGGTHLTRTCQNLATTTPRLTPWFVLAMQTEKLPSPAYIPMTPWESIHQRRKQIGKRRS